MKLDIFIRIIVILPHNFGVFLFDRWPLPGNANLFINMIPLGVYFLVIVTVHDLYWLCKTFNIIPPLLFFSIWLQFWEQMGCFRIQKSLSNQVKRLILRAFPVSWIGTIFPCLFFPWYTNMADFNSTSMKDLRLKLPKI